MDEIRGLFILPLLLYLAMTSGMPPGSKHHNRNSFLQENVVSFSANASADIENILEMEGIIPNTEDSSQSTDSKMDENYGEEKISNSSPSAISSTISEKNEDEDPKVGNQNVASQSNVDTLELATSDMTTTTTTQSATPAPETTGTTTTSNLPTSSQNSAKSDLDNESDENNSQSLPENDETTDAQDRPFHAAQKQTTAAPEPDKPKPTVPLRGKCNTTDQCVGDNVDCRVGICKCALGYLPRVDNGELCGEASAHHVEVPQADPTMIGVVIGLALMSVTLCIVLRLFAKARFRENRTIFNTPNPRLMNVSLLKGSKTLLRGNSGGGQRSRRGSQASVASGNIDGGSGSSHPEGNGMAMAGSSNSHRPKPSRQLSTDTTNDGTPTNKPHSAHNRKLRQDSSASNV